MFKLGKWENFISSVLIHQILPLAPLLFEFGYTNFISQKSLMISVAMYAFSIAFSSKYRLVFSVCLFIGIITSGMYGTVKIEEHATLYSISCFVLVGVFIIHFVERYQRHIGEDEEFFLFTEGTKNNN
jgi:hypothetical protein